MSNQDIIATLRKAGINTVRDLDAWARVRRLGRWQALAVILGVSAADRVLGAWLVKRMETEGA